jgi:branched-chain amino acid transport system substrate-binding protein
MKRREFLKYSVATAVAAPFVRAARADSGVVKVGVVGAKTGPLGPGAAVTHFPPFRLWAHEVNARGGLKLKSGQAKIELIEYDDRTQPSETIKAVERLATVEKADWIGGVFATGFNRHGADLCEVRLSAARSVVRHRSGTGADQEISRPVRVPTIDHDFCQGCD